MSPSEITERSIQSGFLKTEGATPDATMAAQLYLDIKNNLRSPFKKAGKGKFTLKVNEESAASSELIVAKQNNIVRKELRKLLHAMDPYKFELLMGELLQQLGYENVIVTRQSGDKGIDVVADLTLKGITDVKTIVQVKRYKESNKISGDTVTQLRGSAQVDQRGLIITLSDFTKGAKEEARAPNKMPVSLVNGEKLLDLMLENEVAVTKESLPLYSIDSDWLDSFNNDNLLQKPSDKRRGIWPLPGGAESQVDCLINVLDAVQSGANTKNKLTKWFLNNISNVNSEASANSYSTVPRSFGLTDIVNDKIVLTEAGIQFLDSRSLNFLYNTINDNVFAIEEIVEFIESSETSLSTPQVLDFINETMNADWKSNYQTQVRLNWLLCMGKLQKIDSKFAPIKS